MLRKVIDTIFVPISPTIIQHLFSLRSDSSMATHTGQTYHSLPACGTSGKDILFILVFPFPEKAPQKYQYNYKDIQRKRKQSTVHREIYCAKCLLNLCYTIKLDILQHLLARSYHTHGMGSGSSMSEPASQELFLSINQNILFLQSSPQGPLTFKMKQH